MVSIRLSAGKTHAEDDWTRDLNVTIPLSDPKTWRPVAGALSDCVSFVTGDLWKIRFSESPRPLVQKRVRRRRIKFLPLAGDAAALFSGGLDSFVGAVDWLKKNREGKLLLVGHHDRAVKGPKADQLALVGLLKRRFPMRVDSLQLRVGLKAKGDEISFRSRSFLFLAIACFAAEKLGPSCPIIVPENGAIALNPPLTSSRRGACSTRTAHPNFLRQVQAILEDVGLGHSITNPYEFATKGELLAACKAAFNFERSIQNHGIVREIRSQLSLGTPHREILRPLCAVLAAQSGASRRRARRRTVWLRRCCAVHD